MRHHRDHEGATAVEFSLIATLLFMLLFGILHFGLAYHRQQGLHAAAREGARLASLASSVEDQDIVDRVIAAAPAFVRDEDIDVVIDPAEGDVDGPSCQNLGDEVSVTVSLDNVGRYQASIPVIGTFTPHFTVTATFMCETERT